MLKQRYKNNLETKFGDIYKEYLQSYLAWMYKQNTSFYITLTQDEIVNYFLHEIHLPKEIQDFIHINPLKTLSNTYEYIARYKDKTSIFTVSQEILPKKEGPYIC